MPKEVVKEEMEAMPPKQEVVYTQEQIEKDFVHREEYEKLVNQYKELKSNYDKVVNAFNKLAEDYNQVHIQLLFKD